MARTWCGTNTNTMSNNASTTLRYPFVRAPLDWVLFLSSLAVGGAFAWYVYVSDRLLVMVDQYSHLAIARQLTDSLTPGISQLGFWPPLLHLLLAPFAAFDVLFRTGIAAPFALVPVLAAGVVFLYRLVEGLTGKPVMGAVAASAFLLNPYVLYYAVTPMSDTLFLVLLIIAAYFFYHWWRTARLMSLFLLGVSVTLASLARFEGLFLLAFAGVAVAVRLWRTRASYGTLEGTLILYGFPAAVGLVFILVYGWVFGGTPWAFMVNEWGAYAQQRSLTLPAEHEVLASVRYLMAASGYMMGMPLVVAAPIVFLILAWVLRRGSGLFFSVALLLASPLVFDIAALFQGSAVIYVPELYPFDGRFFNERYGLYWFPLALVAVVVCGAWAVDALRTRGWRFEPLALFAGAFFSGFLVANSYFLFARVACAQCFDTVSNSRQVSPEDHARIAEILRREYRGGRVLMTRALANEVAVTSGVPLKEMILEANEHYYAQALAFPWFFAEWVVMQNNTTPYPSSWAKENEKVALLWQGNTQFRYYYRPVFEGTASLLFKLDKEKVAREAQRLGLAADEVPVLAQDRGGWDVRYTYQRLVDALARAGEGNAAFPTSGAAAPVSATR